MFFLLTAALLSGLLHAEDLTTAVKLLEDVQSPGPEISICLPTDHCPDYLIDMIEDDSKKSLLPPVPSPETACAVIPRKKFSTARDLEKGMASFSLTRLSGSLSNIVPRCLMDVPGKEGRLRENRRTVVAGEYYYTMNRFKIGVAQELDEISAIDSILGNQILQGQGCNSFAPFADIQNACNNLQKKEVCSAKGGLGELAKKTLLAQEALRAMNQLDRKSMDQTQRKEFESYAKVFGERYPWMKGEIFRSKCSPSKRCSLEDLQATMFDQFVADRKRHEEKVKRFMTSVSCLHGSKNSSHCNDFEETLEEAPELEFEATKDPAQSDIWHTFNRVKCHREQRRKKAKFKRIRNEAGVMAGTTALAYFTYGTAPILGKIVMTAPKASRARKFFGVAGWSSVLGINGAYLLKDTKEALKECEHILTMAHKEENEMPELTCPKELRHGSGNYAYDYSGCVLASAIAAARIPVVGTQIGALLKVSGIDGAKAFGPVVSASKAAHQSLKKGNKRYRRQFKSSKGKRLFVRKRRPVERKGLIGTIQKFDNWTLNPLANMRNSKREASYLVTIPASMFAMYNLFDRPIAKLNQKSLENIYEQKEALSGGLYIWGLFETGYLKEKDLINIFIKHDKDFSQWLDTGNPKELPRLQRMKEVFGLTPEEYETLNQLALSNFKKELKRYQESDATGTKEEKTSFNENIIYALMDTLEKDKRFSRFSPEHRELLATVYFPVTKIEGADKDDLEISYQLLKTKSPENENIIDLMTQELPLGSALVMAEKASKHPYEIRKKIERAKILLPEDIRGYAERPDLPFFETPSQFKVGPGKKPIVLNDEIDHWRLLSTDHRFKDVYAMVQSKELNQIEAMRFMKNATHEFTHLYLLIERRDKEGGVSQSLSQEVFANSLMAGPLAQLEAASKEKRWSSDKRARKERELADLWLTYHEKLVTSQETSIELYLQKTADLLDTKTTKP